MLIGSGIFLRKNIQAKVIFCNLVQTKKPMTPKKIRYHKRLIKQNFVNKTADKLTCIHIAIECGYKNLAIALIKLMPNVEGTLTTEQAAIHWGELTTRKGTIAAFRQHVANLGYTFPAEHKIVPKNGLKAEYTFKGVCDFAIETLKHAK